jgi:hypothetical protein
MIGVSLQVCKGFKKAAVATARKLATILYGIWIEGTEFTWIMEATT